MRALYKPRDYIAFKLDIDNAAIKQALMKQLDSATVEMIAEFFYEQHFDIMEMRSSFGPNQRAKLPQVLQTFGDFRASGLRIHYWP